MRANRERSDHGTENASSCSRPNGDTTSCGCVHREITSVINRTHGATAGGKRAAEYTTWKGMISRCENEHAKKFPEYGTRGIRVCARWRHSYPSFLADMGTKPTASHSLDRIDVNGNYEPENCRWATPTQQARNTRRNVLMDVNGRQVTVAEAAELLSVSPWTLYTQCRRQRAAAKTENAKGAI